MGLYNYYLTASSLCDVPTLLENVSLKSECIVMTLGFEAVHLYLQL